MLSGLLAVAFTDGVQSQGVGACLKHYVCNDSEFERHTISVEIDARTLREVYLRPFEIAIKQSRPWTVMAAYNRINGVYACSHEQLLMDVLKSEWAFEGLVISDWFAAKETVANALGGLDLEMPGGPGIVWGERLLEAVGEGLVPESIVDDKVRRLLRVIDWSGRFDEPDEQPERALDTPEHRSLAYRAACEGMVLIKNNGVLPLSADAVATMAVIGPNAADFRIMGGGSSTLKPHYVSAPLDALGQKLPGTKVTCTPGCLTHKYIPAPERRLLAPDGQTSQRGLLCRFYEAGVDGTPIDERVIAAATVMLGGIGTETRARAAAIEGYYCAPGAGSHECGLLSTGKARLYIDDKLVIDNWADTTQGEAFFTQATTEKRGFIDLAEGQMAKLRIEFEANPSNEFRAVRYGILPPQPADPIGDAVALASQSDVVLLMVGTNDDWETEGNDRASLDLPGEQNELITRVLATNPNTVVVNNSGSPIAMPWLDQAPAVIQTWFAGQEFGNALVDILIGAVNPSGKLPITFPARLEDTPAFTSYPGEFGKVHYGEGIFVGYRWYDTRDIEPLVPFGHGLSYTTYSYEALQVGAFDADTGVSVSCDVVNTGSRAGLESVQVYVAALDGPVARPRKQLEGFVKVAVEPGECAGAVVQLPPAAFAYWDVTLGGWSAPTGRFRIEIGASSRDIRLAHEIEIAG